MGELLVSGRVMNQVFNSIDVQLFFVENSLLLSGRKPLMMYDFYGFFSRLLGGGIGGT